MMTSRLSRLAVSLFLSIGSSTNTVLANDFSDFEHPTAQLNHVYSLAAGTRVCRDAQTPERPMERCSVLKKSIPVRVLSAIHRFDRSYYLIKPLDGRLPNYYVYRETLSD
jgi:hypothetical protein